MQKNSSLGHKNLRYLSHQTRQPSTTTLSTRIHLVYKKTILSINHTLIHYTKRIIAHMWYRVPQGKQNDGEKEGWKKSWMSGNIRTDLHTRYSQQERQSIFMQVYELIYWYCIYNDCVLQCCDAVILASKRTLESKTFEKSRACSISPNTVSDITCYHCKLALLTSAFPRQAYFISMKYRFLVLEFFWEIKCRQINKFS